MKKFISALLACIMALTVMQVAGMTVFADEVDETANVEAQAEDVSWGYEVISEANKTCKITSVNGMEYVEDYEAHYIIPSKLDGYTVTKVEASINANSITIPKTVTNTDSNYGSFAFALYYEGTMEDWFDANLNIGFSCLYINNNELVQNWVIPEGTEIVTGVPANIESITLPASVKSVDCYLEVHKIYYEGTAAGWVDMNFDWYLPWSSYDTEIYIGGELVKDIVIPEGVKSINRSFDGCSTLETVSIPSTVSELEYGEFRDCSSLKSVEMAEGVKSISDSAFGSSLESAKIPASVNYIGEDAFRSNVVIYGIAGSYAEKYAKENGYKFVSESGNVTAPEFVEKVTDSKTNITVSADKKGVIPEGTVLTVETKSSTANKIVYDITLTKDGKAVQPNGKVTVKIPVSAELGKKANVYRQETNGKYTNMKASYKDGFMVFETEHFSTYVVTTENLDKTTVNTGVKSPNTGASSIMLAAVAASGAVLTLLKKKRDAE